MITGAADIIRRIRRAYGHNHCPFTSEYHPQKPHKYPQTIHTLPTGAARRGGGGRAPPSVPTRPRLRCTKTTSGLCPLGWAWGTICYDYGGCGHHPPHSPRVSPQSLPFHTRIPPTQTPKTTHGLFTHYPQVRRDGEAAVERLPPSLHALDYGALKQLVDHAP